MPLNFTESEVVSETLDALEISSFAVDLNRTEIHVGYDKGRIELGVFVPVVRDQLVTIDGPGFAAAIGRADAYAEAMPPGSVSVYGALKLALYDEIAAQTGTVGSVS